MINIVHLPSKKVMDQILLGREKANLAEWLLKALAVVAKDRISNANPVTFSQVF
jgi:hypothetical protein